MDGFFIAKLMKYGNGERKVKEEGKNGEEKKIKREEKKERKEKRKKKKVEE